MMMILRWAAESTRLWHWCRPGGRGSRLDTTPPGTDSRADGGGASGANSIFSTITSAGGGFGQASYSHSKPDAGDGGSGGGAAGNGDRSGGAGTAGQGNRGGNDGTSDWAACGGGGAGAPGVRRPVLEGQEG